jgi:hypothetical protein
LAELRPVPEGAPEVISRPVRPELLAQRLERRAEGRDVRRVIVEQEHIHRDAVAAEPEYHVWVANLRCRPIVTGH